MATINKSYLDSISVCEELARRIKILSDAEKNAITQTMRFKYQAEIKALNSFFDWVLEAPWEIKIAEV